LTTNFVVTLFHPIIPEILVQLLTQPRRLSVRSTIVTAACCLLCVLNTDLAIGQNSLSVSLTNPNNSTIDDDALLMPAWTGSVFGGSLFGRAINGVGHQSTPLLTHGNFQYSALESPAITIETSMMPER